MNCRVVLILLTINNGLKIHLNLNWLKLDILIKNNTNNQHTIITIHKYDTQKHKFVNNVILYNHRFADFLIFHPSSL